jgi:hypothetical protein
MNHVQPVFNIAVDELGFDLLPLHVDPTLAFRTDPNAFERFPVVAELRKPGVAFRTVLAWPQQCKPKNAYGSGHGSPYRAE